MQSNTLSVLSKNPFLDLDEKCHVAKNETATTLGYVTEAEPTLGYVTGRMHLH